MAFLPKKYSVGDPITAASLNAIQDELKRLGTVSVADGLTMHVGPGGFSFGLSVAAVPFAAVSTSAIPAKPDVSTLGEGTAVLRFRSGATLTDGTADVPVYSNFSVEIPSGTELVVAWDGSGYLVVAADCPDTGGGP